MASREFRVTSPKMELRFQKNETSVDIFGMAVPYASRAEIGEWFTEEFVYGAFRGRLDEGSIVMLTNHGGLPLARVGAKTMSLREEEGGLMFDATLDVRDLFANSIAIQLERGDLTGVSVGFRAITDKWTRGDPPHRQVEEAELFEISLTPFPAYKDTDVQSIREAGLARTQEKNRALHLYEPALTLPRILG